MVEAPAMPRQRATTRFAPGPSRTIALTSEVAGHRLRHDGAVSFGCPGFGPNPGHGPFGTWQKTVSMAVFCAVYAGLAWYVAAVEHDWLAFAWVTGLALLALSGAVGGLRVRRRQKAKEAAAELQRQAKAQHRHPPPHRSRARNH